MSFAPGVKINFAKGLAMLTRLLQQGASSCQIGGVVIDTATGEARRAVLHIVTHQVVAGDARQGAKHQFRRGGWMHGVLRKVVRHEGNMAACNQLSEMGDKAVDGSDDPTVCNDGQHCFQVCGYFAA
jgi:hypothetical protein